MVDKINKEIRRKVKTFTFKSVYSLRLVLLM